MLPVASFIPQTLRQSPAFALIELVIVIAIICVLASLAVSAYQTYTVRAQVDEGMDLASSAMTAVVDMYRLSGSPPAGRLEAGLSMDPTDTKNDYVSRVDVIDGRVEITFGNNAHSEIATTTLSLTPYVSGGEVIWRCGRAPDPGGEPMSEGASSAEYRPGDIDPRYLPSACR